jgi:ABC-type nitrate/sulfonate/bicarbonate transport system substrate-binding protein
MLTIGRRSALTLAAGAALAPYAARAAAPVKMTIATGVDPSFSAFYVAKEAGIFEKNGLDVTVNTGPSGSAMVALVIQNQVQAAFGSEQAGVLDHGLDPNVVVVAEGAVLEHWMGVVAKDVPDMAALKGKKIGVARATGSETLWLALVDKLKLNPKDYTVVNVEAPEMVAALGRGDIDAYAIWEPWLTRGTTAVKGAKEIIDNVGIIDDRVFVYMNKGWADSNHDAAVAFVRSMVQATDRINNQRDAAAADVAKFLKLDVEFTKSLMTKLNFGVRLDQGSVVAYQTAEAQLKSVGKLRKPLDWSTLFYPDLLKTVAPSTVSYKLPGA